MILIFKSGNIPKCHTPKKKPSCGTRKLLGGFLDEVLNNEARKVVEEIKYEVDLTFESVD